MEDDQFASGLSSSALGDDVRRRRPSVSRSLRLLDGATTAAVVQSWLGRRRRLMVDGRRSTVDAMTESRPESLSVSCCGRRGKGKVDEALRSSWCSLLLLELLPLQFRWSLDLVVLGGVHRK